MHHDLKIVDKYYRNAMTKKRRSKKFNLPCINISVPQISAKENIEIDPHIIDAAKYFDDNLMEGCEFIKQLKQKISRTSNKKEILKITRNYLDYLQTFKHQGVQGIAGILQVKKLNTASTPSVLNKRKIVFKTSVDLDRTIEHEHLIIEQLNKIHEYCPHFVITFGMINLPLSNSYVDDPSTGSLLMNDVDYMPSNVLLLEYVSDISFYHVCKYGDHNLVISQLLQMLVGLYVAQKDQFTHYDLHMQNGLIKPCDPDTVSVYRIDGEYIYVPTFGFFPVMIDMGSSYIKEVNGNPMYTGANNYENGLQPTIFDHLNDMHHLLLSVFYYLEPKSYLYNFLSTRILYWFRYVPVMRKKGWKELPYNLLKVVLDRIANECPDVKEFEIYRVFRKNIINILNELIILPWVDQSGEYSGSFVPERSNNCMIDLLTEMEKLYHLDALLNDMDSMYILREIVALIRGSFPANQPWHTIEVTTDMIQKFKVDFRYKIAFLLDNNMKKIPELDYGKMFCAAINISQRLSQNYYNCVSEHTAIISEAYDRGEIKSPLEIIRFISQNATPRYKITNKTTVAYWNADDKTRKFYSCKNLTNEQLDLLDSEPIKDKGKLLLSMVYNK